MKDKLIDMLYENNVRCDQTIEHLADDVIDIVKAEAYKECIEKVKAEINKHSYGVLHKTVINFKLDNLLKEMVGDNNE